MEKMMNRLKRELEEVIEVNQDMDRYFTGWMTRHPLKYKKWLGSQLQEVQNCFTYSSQKENQI